MTKYRTARNQLIDTMELIRDTLASFVEDPPGPNNWKEFCQMTPWILIPGALVWIIGMIGVHKFATGGLFAVLQEFQGWVTPSVFAFPLLTIIAALVLITWPHRQDDDELLEEVNEKVEN